MMKFKFKYVAPAIFLAGLTFSLFLTFLIYRNYSSEMERSSFYYVDSIISNLSRELNNRLILTQSLNAFVQTELSQNKDENVEDFQKSFDVFAAALKLDDLGVLSLQLAPDGVVTYITNRDRNKKALGHDLLLDDERRQQVIATIAAKSNLVAGPLDLIQGGTAIIARKAVFHDSSKTFQQRFIAQNRSFPSPSWLEDLPAGFWGLSTVLIDFEDLKTVIEENRDPRFEIAIRGRHGLGLEGEVFYGSDNTFVEPITLQELEFAGGSWWIASKLVIPISDMAFYALFIALIIPFIALSYLVFKLKVAKEFAESSSELDSLTGLFNRRKMHDELDSYFEIAKRYGVPFSLIMFDLDFFKEVNDKYGHLLGDKALQNIAKVVGENIRKTDVFCRFGGEEFLILCPGVSATEAALIAEKLRNKIEESDSPDYGQLTASFGVMQFEGEETTTQLLSGVDKALYLAKSGGRNRVVLYPRSAR